MRVRMREDLAEDGYEVLAYLDAGGIGDITVSLNAEELEGAECLPDNCKESDPEYHFNRILLKDGRLVYMVGVDLDWVNL